MDLTKNSCFFVLREAEGRLTSPDHPLKYPGNLTCMWIIARPVGCTIQLTISNFSLEKGFDFLNMYDGTDIPPALLGKWSGYDVPPVVQSTTNHLVLLMTSDKFLEFSGFTANYTSCKFDL
ncbi:CUB and sushi domain-containing protein 3 [Clonorchis sinensis]|uniref:CUB and sushi domain-containing protein 3 n=1 Tax=Clonorchis sinensis TaxID=79923 RepID=A0A3R7DBF7_CLOSI|nr:CUB and sushi domain-containing protein 3 [Clonorchis sinensis]